MTREVTITSWGESITGYEIIGNPSKSGIGPIGNSDVVEARRAILK